MRDFATESGAILPEARLVYATCGRLAAARDNVVLLPSSYMARHLNYAWLVRSDTAPDRPLDPDRHFIVATELFGNGHSSSPSNTPAPFDGPRFPVMTIRDNVEATRRLLTEALGIDHLTAVIGFSMGAQQAFQWAVSHPALHGSHRRDGRHREDLRSRHRAARGTDRRDRGRPGLRGGDYRTRPAAGLRAFGMVWGGWLYSQAWWREELWRGATAATRSPR